MYGLKNTGIMLFRDNELQNALIQHDFYVPKGVLCDIRNVPRVTPYERYQYAYALHGYLYSRDAPSDTTRFEAVQTFYKNLHAGACNVWGGDRLDNKKTH